MSTAVLVVDMLRGFCEEGHPLYCGPASRQIIPNIRNLLEQELQQVTELQKPSMVLQKEKLKNTKLLLQALPWV